MTFSYPNGIRHSSLPALTRAPEPLPQAFEDSTHQLWRCDTVEGQMMLKICRPEAVAQSAFWLGMNALFEFNFPHALGNMVHVQRWLSEQGGLVVPDLIAAEAEQYVMVRYLSGHDLSVEELTDQDVIDLATQLVRCHQHHFSHWGALPEPVIPAVAWTTQLQNTLVLLREHTTRPIPAALFDTAMLEAAQVEVAEFVTIMPDLRWDQLRRLTSGELAVVDLDAFVVGPRELMFVLLEYLLSESQWLLLTTHYEQSHPLPDLAKCRMSYRVLLFLMNVLGEEDITTWLKRPHFTQ
jgi:hypothetical protein